MAKETAQDRLKREMASVQTGEFHAFLQKAGNSSEKITESSNNNTSDTQQSVIALTQPILENGNGELPGNPSQITNSLPSESEVGSPLILADDLMEHTHYESNNDNSQNNFPIAENRNEKQNNDYIEENPNFNHEEVGKPGTPSEPLIDQKNIVEVNSEGSIGHSQTRQNSKVKLEIHTKPNVAPEPTKGSKNNQKRKESFEYKGVFLDKKSPIQLSVNKMRLSKKAYTILTTLSKGASLGGPEVGITQLLNNILENHFEEYKDEIRPYIELYKIAEQERVKNLSI